MKVKLFSIILFFGVLFLLLPDIKAAALTNKPGDIIVTRHTSSKGLTGHSGIFIDKNNILHTSGRSGQPYPRVISKKEWSSTYGNSKVVRPNSSTLGKKAADQAKKHFKGKKIKYKVSANPKNISYTYCSELVWYSYYKAGKTFKTPYTIPSIIMPFDFVSPRYAKQNGFSIVDNKW